MNRKWYPFFIFYLVVSFIYTFWFLTVTFETQQEKISRIIQEKVDEDIQKYGPIIKKHFKEPN